MGTVVLICALGVVAGSYQLILSVFTGILLNLRSRDSRLSSVESKVNKIEKHITTRCPNCGSKRIAE